MNSKQPRIKVTSYSFSRHPVLKQEVQEIFPDSVFNPDGPETGLPDLMGFLKDADGVILGIAVGWTGGVNKRSVAEQTLGFMFGICRDLFFSAFPLK